MNIQQAKAEIERTIKAYTARDDEGHYRIPVRQQRPILLMGPPGIGKTAIMEQAAKRCGVGLISYTITHHTRQSAVGLPRLVEKQYEEMEYTVTEYTMSEIIGSIYNYMNRTGLREGILFVDEINCVSETLAPTMLQFLQYKTFGTHRVPEGWIIAAAGNPAQFNKSARELDMAALDRVRRIDVEADADVWMTYAEQMGVHPAILSYLKMRPEYFYRIILTRTRQEFVTARGWEDLSVTLQEYERQQMPVDAAFIREFLKSDEIASDFMTYYQLYLDTVGTYRIPELAAGLLSPEEKAVLAERLKGATAEVRWILTSHLLAASCQRIEEYAVLVHQERREQEVRRLLADYLNEDASHTVIDFMKQRNHALQIRKEHGLLKNGEEQLEKELDEQLRDPQKPLRGPACLTALHDYLNRSIDFLIRVCGREEELADYLLGLQHHKDFSAAGYKREDLKELITIREQEKRLLTLLNHKEETR